jgi:hypothetical protein
MIVALSRLRCGDKPQGTAHPQMNKDGPLLHLQEQILAAALKLKDGSASHMGNQIRGDRITQSVLADDYIFKRMSAYQGSKPGTDGFHFR